MIALILNATLGKLDYAVVSTDKREILTRGRFSGWDFHENPSEALTRIRCVCESCLCHSTEDPDGLELIAIRTPFGNSSFHGPRLADEETLKMLDSLVPQAPMHLPILVHLIESCGETFPALPVALVFETAFFADLPERERLYALGPVTSRDLHLRRYGYHGLYHQAACGLAREHFQKEADDDLKTLSICLEPRPEIAAVQGDRPVMVTSGVTALEGLPGQTTCGEIDPSIVITLLQNFEWGPERINTVLTEESGLVGLAGPNATLQTVFPSNDPSEALARRVMRYRMLLACGAGIAAMGGVDTLVFSGRYAHSLAGVLGPWLASKLSFSKSSEKPSLGWETFTDPLEILIADQAVGALCTAV